MNFWKGLSTLVFICALLYLAGFVWVTVVPSTAPEGVIWLYGYLPWISGRYREASCLLSMALR